MRKLAIAITFLAACGGGSSHHSSGLSAWCSGDLATAICDETVMCQPDGGSGGLSHQDCVALFTSFLCPCWTQLEASGKVSFRSDLAPGCIDAIKAGGCSGINMSDPPPACVAALGVASGASLDCPAGTDGGTGGSNPPGASCGDGSISLVQQCQGAGSCHRCLEPSGSASFVCVLPCRTSMSGDCPSGQTCTTGGGSTIGINCTSAGYDGYCK